MELTKLMSRVGGGEGKERQNVATLSLIYEERY